MYADYSRLREEPFSITPDPKYIFYTDQHREALQHLLYGIRQRKGFICLTGEVGGGKTTLCRALLNQLDGRFRTALILNPLINRTQLLRAVVAEFGVKRRVTDRLDLLAELNAFLLRVNAEGGDTVLIIDEAQDMPIATLEMTRLLSNLETASQKLLQIVLVGQPELRTVLAHPSLRQLAQRITVRYHLRAMSPADTECYIRHRLLVAGAGRNGRETIWFDREAIREIHRLSHGAPRLVNAIGDKALLAAYVHRTGYINRDLVLLAARELKEAC